MANMPKIPLQTLRFLAIGAVAVLGLVLFVIFPYHRALRQADERREALRVQIEEQRTLHPVFVRYLTRLGRGETQIAAPATRPLSREATGNIYGVFQRLTDGLDLTVTEVMPEELRRIRLPVLLAVGDDDPWMPLDEAVRVKRQLPEGRLLVVPECGHVVEAERPGIFNPAMTQFFRRTRSLS